MEIARESMTGNESFYQAIKVDTAVIKQQAVELIKEKVQPLKIVLWKSILNAEKLERLSQKDVVRFFIHMMDEMKLNPNKFEKSIDIESVIVKDESLKMTKVEIILINRFSGKRMLYTDYHALDYSCYQQSLSRIK